MRYLRLVVVSMLLSPLGSAQAQVSIQFSLPGVQIGVNQERYPRLVQVPGYPVYYDPGARSNYFFYDGMYWVYQGDNWYTSTWYNGPWGMVDRFNVPVFLLRVPVRYYRSPPPYFQGWRRDRPPQWGQHWGGDWERQHQGWDRWNRRQAPRPAPLPSYQRQYSGNRYPAAEQQPVLHNQRYRREPRDPVVRQYYPRVEPARAPEPARGHQGKGQPEPKHGSGQQQGDDRGQGHGK